MDRQTDQRVEWATVEAVITRADGTVENLGVIARTDFVGGRPPAGAITRAVSVAKGLLARLRRK